MPLRFLLVLLVLLQILNAHYENHFVRHSKLVRMEQNYFKPYPLNQVFSRQDVKLAARSAGHRLYWREPSHPTTI